MASPASTGAPSPPAGVTDRRPENKTFARLVGYVGVNVGVLLIRDQIRRGGHDANEPDPAEIERTTEATADGIARALGDTELPWWAPLLASWGSLYLSMRVGARPLPKEPADAATATTTATATPAPAPDAPVLGRGVPQPRRSSPYERLPEVAPTST